MQPKGSTFNQGLFRNYKQLADTEMDEADYEDAAQFADRAIASAKDKGPAPEAISARKLPKGKVGELTKARERLVAVLDASARKKRAFPAARAQAMFDCWMQEQEENNQPKDIAACRSAFYSTIGLIEAGMAKDMKKKKKKKVAKKAQPPIPGPFIVYFAYNSTAINAAGQAENKKAAAGLKTVLGAASKKGQRKVGMFVAGHTDRSGSDSYNYALSRKRAQAVRDALVAAGVSGKKVFLGVLGESNTAVSTADGAKEGKNRRVEIKITR
jgi:OOP family OmpA-OmpF porin